MAHEQPVAPLEPLSPPREWRAITFGTLLLVPAFWAMLAGLVAIASDDPSHVNPTVALGLGAALVPLVFFVVARASDQRRVVVVALQAVGLALLVGIPVSAVAGDAVSGIVAGVGAGGAIAIRSDEVHTRRARAVAVVVATVYVFVLVRTVSTVVLLPAPVFPLTATGLADLVSDRRFARQHAAA
jgi:hypothetical protein